jgi:phosphoribosylformylglycinamidine cyclo-ligase
VLRKSAWPRPRLFDWLQEQGGVEETEMHRVFNCGIGMVLVVSSENADEVASMLAAAGETVYRIGAIERRADGQPGTVVT